MADQVSIEHHFEAIERVIAALEDGDLPLEEALKRYEDGLTSVRQAKALLDGFEHTIEELQGSLAAELPDEADAADQA